MILICGIPDEPPVALAIEAAEALGVGHVVFDQRQHRHADIALEAKPGTGVSGTLILGEARIDLSSLAGIYVRLMDDRFLPDIANRAEDDPQRQRSRDLHERIYSWFNIAPCRVASRPRAMLSNFSKTYQASVIRRHGFGIPETLVTTDPGLVRDFVARTADEGGEVIYKSVSGTRSIVQTFGPADFGRLDRIRWCPTQFQRKVEGTDIRVHVVGQRTFATEIRSNATDYRYAGRQTGEDAELSEAELPAEVARRCVALAHALDLPFSGVDLRRTPDGRYVCFEVNPSPAYSYYESRTGAPVARALVSWLAGYEVD